jgi:hypothetical protein
MTAMHLAWGTGFLVGSVVTPTRSAWAVMGRAEPVQAAA